MPRRRPLLSSLLVSLLALPLVAQTTAPGKGRVEGAQALNVRSGAGLDSPVVGNLRQGDEVEVREVRGKWAHVRYRGGEGWVFASFIAMRDTTEQLGETPAERSATATPGSNPTPVAGDDDPAASGAGAEAPAGVSPDLVAEMRGDVGRILTLAEAMHHDLERQRNSPPSATRGDGGISLQSGLGLLALGAVIGLLVGTALGRQQERRGRPRVRL